MWIGLTGYQQSGKDTVGEIIKLLLNKTKKDYIAYQTAKFAGPLKKILAVMLDVSPSLLEHREYKERQLDEKWWFFIHEGQAYSYLLHKERFKNQEPVKPTVRWLLEYIGTDLFRRHLGDAVHLIMFEERYGREENLIITDVRFLNEAKYIEDKGGVIVRINRPGTKPSVMAAESEIDKIIPDITLDNSGDFMSLIYETEKIFKKLGLI